MPARLQLTPTASPPFMPVHSGLLQRKCACGGAPGVSGACAECNSKRLLLSRRPASWAATLPVSAPGDRYEREAEQVAARVVHGAEPALSEHQHALGLSHLRPLIQRQAADEATATDHTNASPEATLAPVTATEITPGTATPDDTPSAGLIVEDEAREVALGQMRKSAFLDELRASVCAIADAELAAVGRTAQGCPYIERWIDHYRTQDSRHVERAIRKYAPEAAGVSTARDYIPIVSQRVQRAVAVWAQTGEVSGVPEELASQLSGMGLLGAIGGVLSGVGSAVSSAASGVVSGLGTVLSGIGGLFFKEREGGANENADPRTIHSQLGSGQALDARIKARMETAFGHDFSRVRVHQDAHAAALSANLNARAFTIGSDIAFGAGEYQPGTLIGDALIAHELAHVVQQSGGESVVAASQGGASEYNALEEAADIAAVGAVVSLWGGAKDSLTTIGKKALPHWRSGLRLQRCGGAAVQQPSSPVSAPGQPTRLIDLPGMHTVMAKMWERSTQNELELFEFSITVIRNTQTGAIRVFSRQGPPIRPGEPAKTEICLPDSEPLAPKEQVLGSIHTHPLLLSEGPPEPNPFDLGTVARILSSPAVQVRCGTEHYVISRDNIYQYDGTHYWPVGDRKAIIGR
jgi:hypothetical protein